MIGKNLFSKEVHKADIQRVGVVSEEDAYRVIFLKGFCVVSARPVLHAILTLGIEAALHCLKSSLSEVVQLQ